jgi:hypothetical protein
MALPTILINATGGSDSAASGAGPTTALAGTAASFSGAVVTLDGSPDLSGVATDGSHVLYLVTSTGSRFFKITAADNGADTVTVTPNPAGTASGLTWAIGGKRASLTSTSSQFLINNGASLGDAKAGWTIRFESGHTETASARVNCYATGDTTDGPVVIEGASGTRPIITLSAADWVVRTGYQAYKNFNLAGTGGAGDAFVDVSTDVTVYHGLQISGFSGVLFGASGGAGLLNGRITGCELVGGSVAVKIEKCTVAGNKIYDQTSHGIEGPSGSIVSNILWNLIYNVSGDGIKITQDRVDGFANCVIANNTIEDATGDGIEYTGDGKGAGKLIIFNNLITNCGGYGINFVSLTAAKMLAYGSFVSHNNTYNNTSGASNLSGVLENDAGTNPSYTGGGDYTPTQATLEGEAFPEAFGL